jgi:hypothetical protein
MGPSKILIPKIKGGKYKTQELFVR